MYTSTPTVRTAGDGRKGQQLVPDVCDEGEGLIFSERQLYS